MGKKSRHGILQDKTSNAAAGVKNKDGESDQADVIISSSSSSSSMAPSSSPPDHASIRSTGTPFSDISETNADIPPPSSITDNKNGKGDVMARVVQQTDDHLPSPSLLSFILKCITVGLVIKTAFLKPDGTAPSSRWMSLASTGRNLCAALFILQQLLLFSLPRWRSDAHHARFSAALGRIQALEVAFWTSLHILPRWANPLLAVKNSPSSSRSIPVRALQGLSSVGCHAFTALLALFPSLSDLLASRFRYLSLRGTEYVRIKWEMTSRDPIIQALHGVLDPKIPCHRILAQDGLGTVHLLARTNSIEASNDTVRLVVVIPGGGFCAMQLADYTPFLSRLLMAQDEDDTVLDAMLVLAYPKAPEHPYPEALDWCSNQLAALLQPVALGLPESTALDVVLWGDSAGANLACLLTARCISGQLSLSSNVHLKGVSMIYPLMSFESKTWLDPAQRRARHSLLPLLQPDQGDGGDAQQKQQEEDRSMSQLRGSVVQLPPGRASHLEPSSRLAFLHDPTLRPELLLLLGQLYTSKAPDALAASLADDPIQPESSRISPLFLPADVLRAFPPVWIQLGDQDPFLDDAVFFLDALRTAHRATPSQADFCVQDKTRATSTSPGCTRLRLGKIAQLSLFHGVSHGYLQMSLLWPAAYADYVADQRTALASFFSQ